MRHARADELDPLAPLLERLRAIPALTEKTPGTFYLKSRAFLHFHIDPTGIFADVRAGAEWVRFRVDEADGAARLLTIAAAVAP